MIDRRCFNQFLWDLEEVYACMHATAKNIGLQFKIPQHYRVVCMLFMTLHDYGVYTEIVHTTVSSPIAIHFLWSQVASDGQLLYMRTCAAGVKKSVLYLLLSSLLLPRKSADLDFQVSEQNCKCNQTVKCGKKLV